MDFQKKRSQTQKDYENEQVDKLSVIHVTGTKGKGSTCCYVEAILRHYGYKTGFFNDDFSSPHLLAIRDRIMLNGSPVDEELFTTAFWHVYNKLHLSKAKHNGLMPSFFEFMLVLALHIFIQEEVDVVLLEVGIGGQYDATNFVHKPLVCGVTSLHLEHTDLLGNTLEEIAWHKTGIMKCPVYVVTPLTEEELGGAKLGIAGDVQMVNASLAVQLCRLWRHAKDRELTSCDVYGIDCENDVMNAKKVTQKITTTNLTVEEKEGLVSARLPGRNQVIKKHGITYYLDGAHTTDSMQQCVAWFSESAQKEAVQLGCKVLRTLVFRIRKDKPLEKILPYLMKCELRRLAFVPNVLTLSDRQQFPDALDLAEDPEVAMKTSLTQLEVWKKLQEHQQEDDPQIQHHPDACSPPAPAAAAAAAYSFPSIVSGLWWAGLAKDRALQRMATEDLTLGKEIQHVEAGLMQCSNGPLAGGGDRVHVQVLVTGSLALAGGVLSIIQPDFWV